VALEEQDWNSIRVAVERICANISGRRVEWFKTGKVIKRDERNRLIWIKGMGDVAIPIIAFDYDIRYYDTDENGETRVRKARATLAVPKLGQTVVVAFELGSTRIPRCLGVLQGKNWVETED
jgi:hypothetical protein